MGTFSKLFRATSHARRIGIWPAATVVGERLWSRKLFLGLRCDLAALPPLRPAQIPVSMNSEASASFDGFALALETARGRDVLEILHRMDICSAGWQTLYVTRSPDGLPAFVQWLIRAADQDGVHESAPGLFRSLAPGESLLEGAYTFTPLRRLGLMTHGVREVLRIAHDEGATTAFTYIAVDNVPSLRACAAAGFKLDSVRTIEWRLGRRRADVASLDDAATHTVRLSRRVQGCPVVRVRPRARVKSTYGAGVPGEASGSPNSTT